MAPAVAASSSPDGLQEASVTSPASGRPLGALTVWARLLNLVRPWWGQLTLTFLLGIAHHGSIIGLGVISALLVGQVFRGGDIALLVALLVAFVPLTALFTWTESWSAHDLAYRLLAEMRIDMYRKLDPLAPGYMVRRRSGDLVSIGGGDIELIEYFFAHTITPLFVAVLVPAGVLITLVLLSWPLALAVSPFLLAVAVSPFFAEKRSERLAAEMRHRLGDVHAHMVDSIQGLREIVAFGRGRARTEEMAHNGWRYGHFQLRFLKGLSFQFGFIEAMTGLGGLAVLTTGIWMVIQGDLARHQLPLVTILSMSAFAPISDLARTMKYLMETLAAARRVFAVHDEPVPVQDGPGVSLPTARSGAEEVSIAFEHVHFSYGPNETWKLRDVTFTINPGQTVALVGHSGAGKTTLANLLLRFWDPTSGRVLLAGHDLREFNLDDLRCRIALVSQDAYLFNASILENLRLGRPDASNAEIEEAARQANAHDFIAAMPHGYDTMVGERGMQLSGGQRQRIAIARALLKNAPVLILDEATSHLDAVNEQQVRQALARLMHGRTTLVIAHRLSTIRDADQIVVLDDGQVVEQGTHQELLGHSGLYAQLVSTQLVGAGPRPSRATSGAAAEVMDTGHRHGLGGHDHHHH
jgi:ATP-binding cassette subfamily B protein